MILRPHLLKEAEYQRKTFEIVLEPGTSLDDVLKPAFWTHVAARLKPRQRIEVHPADGAWCADLIVRASSRVGATVAVLQRHEFAEPDLYGDITEYDIKHRGAAGWSAIRKSDKAVVVEKLPSKEAVATWLRSPTVQAQAA